MLRLIAAAPHGVLPGEHIELQPEAGPQTTSFGGIDFIGSVDLNLNIDGVAHSSTQTLFEVDFLGNGYENSDEYVININTRGLMGTTINGGALPFPALGVGVFKRFVNPENPETKSQYYSHLHKLITNSTDYTLGRTGFEHGIYNRRGRVYSSRRTPPNYPGKTVIREEFKSHLWNVNYDIDRESYFDNHNRPILDLYLTIFPTNKNLIWEF